MRKIRTTDKPGMLRIIGGQWRGRKLAFPDEPGLRPTGDRLRETLFNWLAADIIDARCADICAGSGALGLEALSRGAASCSFVDTSAAAIRQIGKHLDTLQAQDRGNCRQIKAEDYLRGTSPGSIDILFVDPPFDAGLHAPLLDLIQSSKVVVAGGLVYIESARRQHVALPKEWDLWREKTTGEVRCQLLLLP